MHIPSREPYRQALAELWVTGDRPLFACSTMLSLKPKPGRLAADGNSGQPDGSTEAAAPIASPTTPAIAAGNTLTVFRATDGAHGSELWVTDGTAEGTALVADINPGPYGSFPVNFTALDNGTALFRADDGTHGGELWVTDGTAEGSALLVDINPGPGSSNTSYFTALGDGRLLFSAFDGTHGSELWVTDGTAAGTMLVADIRAGSPGSAPSYFTALGNGTAVFSAIDRHGRELWVTDGTAAGTALVTDIDPGTGSSYPRDFTALGDGKLLFGAFDATHGRELWVTDGTPAGTVQVADISPGASSSDPRNFIALSDGRLLFTASDVTHGSELWVTDGTAAGTALLADISPGPGSSDPRYFATLGNGTVLFRADDGTHGDVLWVTDGTTEGTALVAAIGNAYDFTALGDGRLLFSGFDATHGQELWVTDGTAAGTALVADISPGKDSSYPHYFTPLGNGTALFSADDGAHGYEVWATDGTAAGTALVENINLARQSAYPRSFTVIQAPCYCRGTLIRTGRGEVAVEDLAVGERVVTLSGELKPVRWIGRRGYDGRFIAGNRSIWPMRVAAGALGEGLPARDLFVSPEHSLHLGGVLVQAMHLANGATITQPEPAGPVEYFHIELDEHDVVFAEGAPAETFVDCDNRLMFENGAEFLARYPDDDRPRWRFCLPRLERDAPELTAIRAALLERAEILGHRFDTDPDLCLTVDGATVPPDLVEGLVYRFAVPAGTRSVWLCSRNAVPTETAASARDVRRLGVAVESLTLRAAGRVFEARHDDDALGEGFHADEGTHRWTDGHARLPAAWLRRFRRGGTIEVRLASRDLRYRLPALAKVA